MRILVLLLSVWSVSAFGITMYEDPGDVTCVPSVDQFANLYINIQVDGKTVAPYMLDNNQTIGSPEANAAVAYCQSITKRATQLGEQVIINTDISNFGSGEALQVADPNCYQPPSSRSLDYRRTYSN